MAVSGVLAGLGAALQRSLVRSGARRPAGQAWFPRCTHCTQLPVTLSQSLANARSCLAASPDTYLPSELRFPAKLRCECTSPLSRTHARTHITRHTFSPLRSSDHSQALCIIAWEVILPQTCTIRAATTARILLSLLESSSLMRRSVLAGLSLDFVCPRVMSVGFEAISQVNNTTLFQL